MLVRRHSNIWLAALMIAKTLKVSLLQKMPALHLHSVVESPFLSLAQEAPILKAR
jgi:hypothetical protein